MTIQEYLAKRDMAQALAQRIITLESTPSQDFPGGWRERDATTAGLQKELERLNSQMHRWYPQNWQRVVAYLNG